MAILSSFSFYSHSNLKAIKKYFQAVHYFTKKVLLRVTFFHKKRINRDTIYIGNKKTNITTKKEGNLMSKTTKLSPDQQKFAINQLQTYFLQERDEELSELSSMLLLDFISQKLGPMFYNKGVEDSQRFMSERVEDLYALLLKEQIED